MLTILEDNFIHWIIVITFLLQKTTWNVETFLIVEVISMNINSGIVLQNKNALRTSKVFSLIQMSMLSEFLYLDIIIIVIIIIVIISLLHVELPVIRSYYWFNDLTMYLAVQYHLVPLFSREEEVCGSWSWRLKA